MNHNASRPKCLAGVGPLERRVRPLTSRRLNLMIHVHERTFNREDEASQRYLQPCARLASVCTRAAECSADDFLGEV